MKKAKKELGEHLCLICKMGRYDGVSCKDLMAHAGRYWDA